MTIRTRLKALERRQVEAAAEPLTGMALFEATQRYHQECDRWQEAFVRGEELPLPVPPDAGVPGDDPARRREALAYMACVRARMDGAIGPTDYLPAMTEAERREADIMCGVIFTAETIRAGGIDEGPFPWPEWEQYVGTQR